MNNITGSRASRKEARNETVATLEGIVSFLELEKETISIVNRGVESTATAANSAVEASARSLSENITNTSAE